MEIIEAHKQRRELERGLFALIAKFEEQTELTVESLEITRGISVNVEHFRRTGATRNVLVELTATVKL